MTKIRTLLDLNEALDREMSWRKRELINLKLLHDSARDHQAVMLRRGGVALLYAHWEGFVKCAGTAYVEFVARRGLRYRELRSNFVALGMKGILLKAQETIRGVLLTEIAEFFLGRAEERAVLTWKGAVQTKANLSSARLRDILAILGLNYAPFQLREKTVIDRLLDQRNNVAHGHYLDIDQVEFDQLHKEVLEMLEEVRHQVETAAQTSSFQR